jgi:cytochrome c biogenesis protein CcdA
MRETKFLAGLATILVFAGIFCFKALSQTKVYREGLPVNTPLKPSTKIILIVSGCLAIISGVLLFIQCFKLIQNPN